MQVFDKFPLAASGWPYLLGYGFLAGVASALEVWSLAIFLWLATAFIAFFFRDPARHSQAGPDAVLSPADGKVVVAEEMDCPLLPGGRALVVSIFMNLHDVHVNRAPMSGKVTAVNHFPGGYLPADRPQAMTKNERVETVLTDDQGRTLVVTQVAGLVARRIENRLLPGQEVQRGQRFGMIRFGSRLDLYLPPSSRLQVALGQRVKAGVSTIAEM